MGEGEEMGCIPWDRVFVVPGVVPCEQTLKGWYDFSRNRFSHKILVCVFCFVLFCFFPFFSLWSNLDQKLQLFFWTSGPNLIFKLHVADPVVQGKSLFGLDDHNFFHFHWIRGPSSQWAVTGIAHHYWYKIFLVLY